MYEHVAGVCILGGMRSVNMVRAVCAFGGGGRPNKYKIVPLIHPRETLEPLLLGLSV